MLEEHARRSVVGHLGHVVHELVAHAQAGVLNLAIVVFACPHTGVDHKLELTAVKSQKSWEAVQVDGFEEFEEFDTMLRIFGEVFVDHFQRAFKDIFHDRRNLVLHEALIHSQYRDEETSYGGLTENFEVCLVQRTCSLVMMVVITFKTSASRASGTLRL